jgi:hypothetical protein
MAGRTMEVPTPLYAAEGLELTPYSTRLKTQIGTHE